MELLLTWLVKALFYMLRWLPVRWCGALGAGLGRLACLLDHRHREIAQRNLQRVYPEQDAVWCQRMARESFAELGRTIFELPHVFLRSGVFLRSRVDVRGEDALRQALQQGKGVILNACHHSNWELGALMLSLLGYSSVMVYRPLRQSGLDRFLKECRERFGARMHSRYEGLRWLSGALRRGDLVGLMIDQHVSSGEKVPFLGLPANTTLIPAAYAIKYQTPMFGVALHRLGRGFHFRLEFWPVPLPGLTGEATADQVRVMSEVNASFQPVIDARPELWLWTHRRWRVLDEHRNATVAEGA
jgi:KDO2-lipid IV(A) lauroyltransferase